MGAGESLPQIEVKSRKELRAWLKAHHKQSGSVWLVTFKKATPEHYVPYDEIVKEALCFGWVDSLPRKLDAERSMLLLSPRKSGSAWSAANKARIEELTAQKLMRPAGLAVVQAAKADGSWSFLDDVDRLVTPNDLATALRAYSAATEHFNAFPRSTKRGILEWIKQAKRPETRAKRVEATARLASENKRANQFRQS